MAVSVAQERLQAPDSAQTSNVASEAGLGELGAWAVIRLRRVPPCDFTMCSLEFTEQPHLSEQTGAATCQERACRENCHWAAFRGTPSHQRFSFVKA